MNVWRRRRFLKLSALAPAGFCAETVAPTASGTEPNLEPRDFSPGTGRQRKAIPSACWQCVTRCAIVGFVENGRVVKIEGNPRQPSSRGKICARGQAGINQVYHPDRLLHPMKRVGKRGEGKWQRISWEEALDLLVNGGEIAGRSVRGLKSLRDAGTPEKFMFHYGRMVGSDWLIVVSYFLTAYGTGTIGDHTSICNAAGPVANQFIRGRTYGRWDFDKAAVILNFGSSLLEAHTNHLPMAERCMEAMSRAAKMYTFDVRLSNTAAKSTEWIPVKPATDLAVVLAMCHVLIEEELHDEAFIRNYTNVTVEELEEHLASYTPKWAEGVSGVPAEKIRSIAREYGTKKPGLCISFRGAFMHYNGVETERAIQMLEAIAGNVDATGGSGGVGPKWSYPFTFPRPDEAPKKLDILDGEKGAYAYPLAHVSHQVLSRIDKGPERPEIYMTYCHNPVYSNGDCGENARILADEEKVPFLVSVDVALSETTGLADLVLPDATYLERWTCEGKTSPEHIPEYYIRQPMHPPLGEARNFCDVVCDLGKRLGLGLGFDSAEQFVRATCDATPGVREAGGFDYMRRNGVWCDTDAEPSFFRYREEVDVSGATLDPVTGVYYRKGDSDYGSLDAAQAAMRYVAQKCGDGKARRGFPPGYGVKKSGLFEIKSKALVEKGFPSMPTWRPDPTHERMTDDELILTTFKVSTQSHSRTQNCKWLTELYHENPAWIHPETAAERGIEDGDPIIVESQIGRISTRARVTEAVHPAAVAISNHCGHWAYGVYASGKPSHDHTCEPDCRLKWWEGNGVHPNHIIPNRGDPIAGSMCWNDTVVRVRKA